MSNREFLTDDQRDVLYDACAKVFNEQSPNLRTANPELFLTMVSAVWKEVERLLFVATLRLEADERENL